MALAQHYPPHDSSLHTSHYNTHSDYPSLSLVQRKNFSFHDPAYLVAVPSPRTCLLARHREEVS